MVEEGQKVTAGRQAYGRVRSDLRWNSRPSSGQLLTHRDVDGTAQRCLKPVVKEGGVLSFVHNDGPFEMAGCGLPCALGEVRFRRVACFLTPGVGHEALCCC